MTKTIQVLFSILFTAITPMVVFVYLPAFPALIDNHGSVRNKKMIKNFPSAKYARFVLCPNTLISAGKQSTVLFVRNRISAKALSLPAQKSVTVSSAGDSRETAGSDGRYISGSIPVDDFRCLCSTQISS